MAKPLPALIRTSPTIVEGGNLLFTEEEKQRLVAKNPGAAKFAKRVYGASEYIRGEVRFCLWISDYLEQEAKADEEINRKLNAVAAFRLRSPKVATKKGAAWPHKFEEVKQTGNEIVTIVPKVSSESREYLPVGLLPKGSIVTDLAFALYDAPLWNMALIASRLHLVWIGTVCSGQVNLYTSMGAI
ncbi:MAG: type IIL restriction-modification enzyme MmeI [Pseudomonadota bacterium]